MKNIDYDNCPCGHATCKDKHLIGIGTFVQGSGFTEAEAELICNALNGPKVGDGTPDAALAIGEHAFRAGFRAGIRSGAAGPEAQAMAEEGAWDDYTPPESIKALS